MAGSSGIRLEISRDAEDARWLSRKNRFNGFDTFRETVETVPQSSSARYTPLKRGVNEIR